MAEAELRGVITGDASDFIAESKKAQTSLDKLAKAGKKTNTALKTTLGGTGAKSVLGGLLGTLGKVGKAAGVAGKALTTAFGAALKVVKVVAVGVGALATAIGGIAIAAVANFAKFQSSFSQVRTLVDESKVNVAELSEGVRELSVAFGVDAVQATEAAYQAISAGQDPARVLDFLKIAFEGAAAGAASTVEVVDLFTSALNTFAAQGLTAEAASDVLFTTVRLGKTTITELAASFGQVGPIANAAGISFSELGAALATTTASGLSTAEAATAIKATISGIVNPAGDAAKALASIGVSAASLREEGLVETLAKIGEAAGGTIEGLIRFVPNIRAVNAAAILAGTGLAKFRENADATANALGAAGIAFGKVAGDITLQFGQLRSTISEIFRTLGEALAPVASALTKVFKTFANTTRNEVTALARVMDERLGQAEEALTDLEGTASTSGGAVTFAIDALSTVLGLVSRALTEIAGPIGTASTVLGILNNAIRIGPLVGFLTLATAISSLLQIISFLPKVLLEAAAAIARFTGATGLARSLDDARASIEGLTEGAAEFASDLRSQLGAAIEGTVDGIVDFGEQSDETARKVKAAAKAVREAAKDVKDFSKEVGESSDLIEFEKRLDGTEKALGGVTGKAKTAATAMLDLGVEASTAATQGLAPANTAAKALSETLKEIAGGSADAARGLSDLGPIAEKIGKAIAGIGTAQTEEQSIKRRGEALAASLGKAAADRDIALRAAFARRQTAIAPATEERRAAFTAQNVARATFESEGAGPEALQDLFDAEQRFEEAVKRQIEVTEKATKAFKDQERVATEAYEAVREEISKTSAGLDALRENTIANAKAQSAAQIEEITKARDEAVALAASLRESGTISFAEEVDRVLEAAETLNRRTETAEEILGGRLDRIGERFEKLAEKARDARETALFDEFFGPMEDDIDAIASKLTGEFSDAVNQAREDAETYGFSQDQLNEALKGIVEQSKAAGEATEEAGDKNKEAAKTIEELTKKLSEGTISLKEFEGGVELVGTVSGLTGKELDALIKKFAEVAKAAEDSSARIIRSAANRNRRGDIDRRGSGETRRQVNERLGGLSFGIGPRRRRTVEGVFESLSASQRNEVRRRARAAGAKTAKEFTQFVTRGSPELDPGGLSFDLGGVVRVDQLARLQAGERVLTRDQNSALGSLVAGFFGGGRASNQTINVSPTFNIEGGNVEDNRAMARSLIPEITRATRLGVTGKSLL